MRVVFCTSYIQVPTSISLIEDFEDDFLIVTTKSNIYELMSTIYPKEKIEQIVCDVPPTNNPIKLFTKTIDLHRCKEKYMLTLGSLEGADIYFFFVAFCEFEAWLVKLLSKKNRIFYKPAATFTKKNEDRSLTSKLGRNLRKILYGIDFNNFILGNKKYYAIDEQYLRDVDAKEFEYETNSQVVKEKIIESFGTNLYKKKVLILEGGISKVHVEEKIYPKVVDDVIDVLEREYDKSELLVKAHPDFHEYVSRQRELDNVNPIIPISTLIDEFEIVVGYNNYALVEAARLGKTSISLLKLAKSLNPKRRDDYIAYLKDNSKNKVFFPNNLNEFDKIISGGNR